MKKGFSILLTIAILLTMASCGSSEQTISESSPENIEPESETPVKTISTEPDQKTSAPETVKIPTPYCDLTVSAAFAENVKSEVTSQEPYTVAFYTIADNTELFALVFGGETENLIGTLMLEDKAVIVYAAFSEFDEADDNCETYYEYQEEINTVIQHLISDYGLLVNQAVEWEDQGTFDIETSVVTMKYPAKWQGKVTIDVSEEKVSFSTNGTPLFDLVFSECDGYLLGTYNDTPIYIVEYPVTTDEQAAMQEDVNVILQYLMEDPSFDINI